jgi:hypothetical protein
MENTMEKKNKKFRNPFPAVGKIFKYEMISAGRIILPVYALLLVLSLFIGIFVMSSDFDFDGNGALGIFKTAIVILTTILFVVMIVIIFSIIERRYKKSILGDEGYLNLTLPVTVGEHLWGRYLADIVWALSYAVIMLLAVALIFIRGWNQIPQAFSKFLQSSAEFKLQYGYGYGYIFCCSFINCLIFFMLICIFIYMTETVIQLIGKHRTLMSILIFVVVFLLFQNIAELVFKSYEGMTDFKAGLLWSISLYNFVWCVILSVITRLVLMYKLNLE